MNKYQLNIEDVYVNEHGHYHFAGSVLKPKKSIFSYKSMFLALFINLCFVTITSEAANSANIVDSYHDS